MVLKSEKLNSISKAKIFTVHTIDNNLLLYISFTNTRKCCCFRNNKSKNIMATLHNPKFVIIDMVMKTGTTINEGRQTLSDLLLFTWYPVIRAVDCVIAAALQASTQVHPHPCPCHKPNPNP